MLGNKLSITDIKDFKNKKVLVRVDFNVPIENGIIKDDTRITATLPTIKHLKKEGASKIILISHCGRPDGLKNMKYTLKPVAEHLKILLEEDILFLNDCIGKEVENEINNAKENGIILLENLRFHIEEEGKGIDENGNKVKATKENIEIFQKQLTKLGDIFINDAFGTAHRSHSSMIGIHLNIKASGFLMKKELQYFSKILENPNRPVLAILGGAKISDKIQLIINLLDKVDKMIIGGGMAYTFKFVLNNMKIGNSLFDELGSKIINDIVHKAKCKNVEILLPVDFKIADKFDNNANTKIVSDVEGIDDNWMGLDAGPKSIDNYKNIILNSKTIIWNGPQGVFEMPNFAKGSIECLNLVIEATKNGAISIVGGGDTASLVEQQKKKHLISHVSTGGGASLELLEGKELPGVAALSNNFNKSYPTFLRSIRLRKHTPNKKTITAPVFTSLANVISPPYTQPGSKNEGVNLEWAIEQPVRAPIGADIRVANASAQSNRFMNKIHCSFFDSSFLCRSGEDSNKVATPHMVHVFSYVPMSQSGEFSLANDRKETRRYGQRVNCKAIWINNSLTWQKGGRLASFLLPSLRTAVSDSYRRYIPIGSKRLTIQRRNSKKSVCFSSAGEVFEYINDEKNDIEIVACIISNLLGSFFKCFFYVSEISESKLENGFPFDASSIKLCSDTEVSDFYIKADFDTCYIEECNGRNVLNVLCYIKRYNGFDYYKCPRTILKKACDFVKQEGVADTVCMGNEIEFFIFDKVNYSLDDYNSYVKVYDRESFSCKNNIAEIYGSNVLSKTDSFKEQLNNTNNDGLINDDSKKVKKKCGYFATDPYDTSNLIKLKICRTLNDLNINVQRYHHEVSTSQHEISLKYFDAVKNADNLLITKQVIKTTVHAFNRTATFMPKPLVNDNGNGLHCNISLWKNKKNIFFSNDPSTFFLSKESFYFMNGIIKHAKALQAFCNSTINSYKRLVPGFETCQKLFYSFGSRSAVIRLSLLNYSNPSEKRIEFRLPDYVNSPHLIMAAIILAGYDGIKSKEQPLVPFESKDGKFYISSIFSNYIQDTDKFETLTHALSDYTNVHNIKENPEFVNFFKCKEPENISFSLAESLDALEKDHDFLTVNNVFTKELIEEYIKFKREEVASYNKIVNPYDYLMYYGC
ncbi:glutamine synthetase, putative [Plasmodium ovale curtisi]|nr:glutamine synthetase, putative [Plasmodium ovale curtisi]